MDDKQELVDRLTLLVTMQEVSIATEKYRYDLLDDALKNAFATNAGDIVKQELSNEIREASRSIARSQRYVAHMESLLDAAQELMND